MLQLTCLQPVHFVVATLLQLLQLPESSGNSSNTPIISEDYIGVQYGKILIVLWEFYTIKTAVFRNYTALIECILLRNRGKSIYPNGNENHLSPQPKQTVLDKINKQTSPQTAAIEMKVCLKVSQMVSGLDVKFIVQRAFKFYGILNLVREFNRYRGDKSFMSTNHLPNSWFWKI